MTKRIFFKGHNSAGKFPDGHIKLDVHFEDSQHNKYVWTPDWEKGTRSFFLEAYRLKNLNGLKGPEIEKFKQTAREVLCEEEIESYDEFYGELERIEEGQVIIGYFPSGDVEESFVFSPSDIEELSEERKIRLSIEFRAKIMEETRSLLN